MAKGMAVLRFRPHHNALAPARLTIYEIHMAQTATIFAPSAKPLTLAALVLPQASHPRGRLGPRPPPLRQPPSGARGLSLAHHLPRRRAGAPDLRHRTALHRPPVPRRGCRCPGRHRRASASPRSPPPPDPRPVAHGRPALPPSAASMPGPGFWPAPGLLNGHKATVHWEDLEDLAAAHPADRRCPRPLCHRPQSLYRRRCRPRRRPDAAPDPRHATVPPPPCRSRPSFITTARDGSEPQILAAKARPPPRPPRRPNHRPDGGVAGRPRTRSATLAAKAAPVAPPPGNAVPPEPWPDPCRLCAGPAPGRRPPHGHRHRATPWPRSRCAPAFPRPQPCPAPSAPVRPAAQHLR